MNSLIHTQTKFCQTQWEAGKTAAAAACSVGQPFRLLCMSRDWSKVADSSSCLHVADLMGMRQPLRPPPRFSLKHSMKGSVGSW